MSNVNVISMVLVARFTEKALTAGVACCLACVRPHSVFSVEVGWRALARKCSPRESGVSGGCAGSSSVLWWLFEVLQEERTIELNPEQRHSLPAGGGSVSPSDKSKPASPVAW